MALHTKTIKNKMKSVGNVKKITRAMEKVAAVKMRRIVAQTLAAREYAYHVYELLHNVLHNEDLKHPYFIAGKGKKILFIAISSNRGLCGNINTQLGRTIKEYSAKHSDTAFDFVAVGKKMELFAKKLKHPLVASFTTIPDIVTTRDILILVDYITTQFMSGTYKEIVVGYNHFVSALSRTSLVRQILPLEKDEIQEVIEKIFAERFKKDKKIDEYILEPTAPEVLEQLIPKILEIKLYKILLETRACEYSARMMAMKNASDNAQGLLEDLTISFNRARQGAITQEISEIAAGAAAVSH